METFPGLPNDIGLECLVRIPYKHFSSVLSVCRSWKEQIDQPEFWLHRKASGLSQQVIVMAQARSGPTGMPEPIKSSAGLVYRLTAFEPETGCWAELPSPSEYSDGLPMFCQLIGVGINLVVIGGLSPVTWEISNKVYVYDFVSTTWRRGADMPGCRRLFFACSASDSNQMMFVAGGHDDEKNGVRSALAYDVAKDKWIILPDMARERDECKGIFHGGKFRVIGGYHTNTQGRFETSAEGFDLANWEWDAPEDDYLATATCPSTCVDAHDTKEYICQHGVVLARDGTTWHAIAKLPDEIRNTTYVTAWQGKLMVIGSMRFNDPYQCYTLDLGSLTWTRIHAAEDFSGHVQSGCRLEV